MGSFWTSLRPRLLHGAYLVALPGPVRRFYWRAWRERARLGDTFSFGGATKPRELLPLLRAAQGAKQAVEVGTGTAWTAIALAVADSERRVITFDPVVRQERERYLALVDRSVVDRISFRTGPGEEAPDDVTGVDFLFIDAAHDLESTRDAFAAWQDRLSEGAVVAFHDFNDPRWPGVTEAIQELGLRGHARDHLFVWRRAS